MEGGPERARVSEAKLCIQYHSHQHTQCERRKTYLPCSSGAASAPTRHRRRRNCCCCCPSSAACVRACWVMGRGFSVQPRVEMECRAHRKWASGPRRAPSFPAITTPPTHHPTPHIGYCGYARARHPPPHPKRGCLRVANTRPEPRIDRSNAQGTASQKDPVDRIDGLTQKRPAISGRDSPVAVVASEPRGCRQSRCR